MALKVLRSVRAYSSQSEVTKDLASLSRFWEKITVENTPTSRQVCLGKKPMKTPEGNTMSIPLHKPAVLASLIAQEWQVLSQLKLKSHMVPLTSLAGRSIDMTPEERERVTQKLLPYLDTDTLVVLSPSRDCNGELRKAQLELYPSVLDDACNVWGLKSSALNVLDTENTFFGNYQSEETKKSVLNWIRTLDNWQFASLERATTAARSLIIAMNTVLHLRPVSELAKLSSLDVIHQTAVWGEVEDTHDVEREDLHRLLGASYINALTIGAKN